MKTYIMVLAITFLLSACAEKKTELSSESEAIEGGTWATGCLANGSSSYVKIYSSFVGGQFTQTSSMSASSTCSLELIRLEAAGSYALTGKQSEETRYQKIDQTLATYVLTVYDASLVSYYNTNSYCGYSNWTIAVAKDIAGRNCGGTTIPSVGTMVYDIFYAGGGLLQFGGYDGIRDGSTEALRPVSLSADYVYSRQ